MRLRVLLKHKSYNYVVLHDVRFFIYSTCWLSIAYSADDILELTVVSVCA